MDKRRFDDSDYSVVVKNKGSPPNSWKWEMPLVEAAQAGSLDSRDMDKNISSAALRLNKSLPFLRIEPLHRTGRHF
jgi:hypothetical protein